MSPNGISFFVYVPLPKKFAPVFVEASMHPISKQE
jgi:hypothetical protein